MTLGLLAGFRALVVLVPPSVGPVILAVFILANPVPPTPVAVIPGPTIGNIAKAAYIIVRQNVGPRLIFGWRPRACLLIPRLPDRQRLPRRLRFLATLMRLPCLVTRLPPR